MYLSTTERAVAQHTTVFTGKWYTLSHTLVNDVGTYFGQTMYVGLTGTIVTTFDGIVEQAINAVTIILIVFGSVDTTLCCDRVRTTRGILEAECFYFIS
ncbi:hypothetical protein D9M68_1000380 [compost metagenome]